MFNASLENLSVLAKIKRAARDDKRVTGLTHRHYKYPARFSPTFAATALELFSKPGDLILDPYMGGGTTLVEAMVRGRRAVGCDLNSLAIFVSRAKTTTLSSADETELRTWATIILPQLSYHDWHPSLGHILCEKRTHNLHLPRARPIKKFVALALISLDTISSAKAQDLARCALLKVSQWALNGKRRPVSLSEFRSRLSECVIEMLNASASLTQAAHSTGNVAISPVLIHDSAERIAVHSPFCLGQRADLVVTSPPYPGVHVLYHRWQVDGRRETPAPYWIANCLDGQGSAFYNFGARRQRRQQDYFETSLRTLQSIRSVMKDGAVMVQLVAFSNPRSQLARYLNNMLSAGFREIRRTDTDRPARTWRSVPGRSWHATLQGQTRSAREVVLLHVAA
jgi:DNA modification methylase